MLNAQIEQTAQMRKQQKEDEQQNQIT